MRKLDWSACGARVTQVGAGEGKELLLLWGSVREAVRWVQGRGKEGGVHGREEVGLLDRAGWGAILGWKNLPTAFGTNEGKRR